MTQLIQALIRNGVPLVFFNVFLEQIGAPVPALPTLVIAGALSRDHRISSTDVLVAAVAASILADWIWFMLGRRYGYRILRTLCRISLSPDSCVRETEARFERWGLKSLLIAKFIPGFSTVAPPLAGVGKRSTIAFLLYDGIGAAAWAGAGVATGRLFHLAIDDLLRELVSLGWWAVVAVTSAVVLFVAYKWVQRRNFYRRLRMARITVDELKNMIDSGTAPLIVDARSSVARQRDPRRIPTAVAFEGASGDPGLELMAVNREIIVYCT